uniref:eIF-4F 25 kDa subunit n=2 Tax=Parascaris univalens TaxID=6257 RepID=A0A914ZW85_PARUN
QLKIYMLRTAETTITVSTYTVKFTYVSIHPRFRCRILSQPTEGHLFLRSFAIGNKEVRKGTKMSSGDVKKNKLLPQDTNSVEENRPLVSDESTPVMKTKTMVTVIPEQTLIRHPLQYQWVLWYLKADRNKEWHECLMQVAFFSTIEDFWALYNMIQQPSAMNWGSDYYLFKEGVKPMWEDENNVKGGRWLIVVDRQRRSQLLDRYWLELLMAIIGEQFEDYGDHVCGAAVNIRQRGDKVSLWTKDFSKDDANLRIGQILKAKLNIPDSDPMRYEAHMDGYVRSGPLVKPRILIPGGLNQ